MVFLNWFHGYENKWIYVLLILGVAVATYHAIMPVALTLSMLVVLVFYDVFPRIGVVKANTLSRHRNSKMWWVVAILVAVLIFHNAYITVFITRSIAKTLALISQGGEIRLDVYTLMVENPELRWQYDVIANIERMALLLLLGIPSAIVALSLLIKYLRSKLSIIERVFFAIAVIASTNVLLFIIFGVLLQTGLVERFYQISYLTSPVLTAYLYENSTNPSSQRFGIRKLRRAIPAALLVTFAFIPLSMFTAPSYVNLYADAFGKPEFATAQWVANHLSLPRVYLDGNYRLNNLIALYIYPKNVWSLNLSITREIERKAVKGDYVYPPGTIITTRKPTIIATTIKGLSDATLNKYIKNMPLHLDKLFSNYNCEVFIYR